MAAQDPAAAASDTSASTREVAMMRPAVPAERKQCGESVADGAAREPQPDGAGRFVPWRKASHQRHAEWGEQYLRDGEVGSKPSNRAMSSPGSRAPPGSKPLAAMNTKAVGAT